MSRVALAGLAALLAVHGASAALTSNLKLAQQLPQVGHMSEPYSWTISAETFIETDSSRSLADAKLDAQGLPRWAKFDAASRTFSGTPTPSDIGRNSVKVTATDGDGAGAEDTFELVVVAQPSPVVAKSLTSQLSVASSLGSSNILPGDRLHIPPGWSFSLGFDGATFTCPDGSSVYMTPALGNFQPLPSWLNWSPDTYALYGVAPPTPGPEGNSFDFVLTGSNVQGGFGGVSTSVTLVVSPHALTPGGALKPQNVTAGTSLSYTVPTTGLRLDGKPNPPSNHVQVAADLSAVSWLSFDANSNVLSGTPPIDTFKAADVTPVTVPLTYRDTFNNTIPSNVTVNVFASPFTLQALPNVEVELGQPFTVPLASYVRKLNDSDHPAVSATFDPPVSWMTFDNASYVLSGTAQKTTDATRVTVNLRADAAVGDAVQTSFQLGGKGDKSLASPTAAGAAPTNGSTGGASSSSGGLSHKAKLALGVALGSIGGLILLILLMMCCRRKVAVEEHDHRGNLTSAIVDDDKTMTASPASADYKKSTGGGKWGTPSTLAASPNHLHPEWMAGGKKGGSPAWGQQPLQDEFVEVNMNDPFAARGRGAGGYTQHLQVPRKQVPALIEQPRRVSAFSIFKRGPSAKDLAAQARAEEQVAYTRSPPSGLGLEGVIVESPAEGEVTVRHSRTRHSVLSHRSSWEDGIFESRDDIAGNRRGSGAPSEVSFHSADDDGADAAEVPRRRGGAGPMRQRNQYANHSPAFITNGTFDGEAPVASSVEGSEDPFEDSRTGLESDEGGATYHTGVRVDVRNRQQGSEYIPSHRANKSRGGRSSMDQSAFMDAPESDENVAIAIEESPATKRVSAASAASVMTHNSHLRALEPYIATGEAEAGPSSAALSPRPPSFFGGSSYNGDAPEETLRAVPTRRMTTEPSTPRENSRGPLQTGHWGEQDELIELEVGRLPSLIIAPKWGPQLSGPGSPGKRGGRRPKYRLIVNDERFPEDSGTWPVWLRDWTQWNEERCELLFTVPISEELAYEIGEVRITLQECKNWAAQPPSPAIGGYNAPGSPGKRGSIGASGHRRNESTDSARTYIEERWEDCLSKVLAFVLPEREADVRRPSDASTQSPYAF